MSKWWCPGTWEWPREAISDEQGQADMAYVAIGALTVAAIVALAFVCVMSAISYHRCQPQTVVATGQQAVTSVTSCQFDPLPVGQAAGLIFGAFGALIGALAGYMAATRKARPQYLVTTDGEQRAQPLPVPRDPQEHMG